MFHLNETSYAFSQLHEDNRGRELSTDFNNPSKPRKKSPKKKKTVVIQESKEKKNLIY